MQLEVYTGSQAEHWDAFIERSNNGTFLFKRNYMDYHADRFDDHSIIIKDGNTWLGVMPGCIVDNAWISHAGLSYGGLITTGVLSQNKIRNCLTCLLTHLKELAIAEVKIKLVPAIYFRHPDFGLDYALFASGFELYRKDLSCTLFLNQPFKFSKGRKASIARAKKMSLHTERSHRFNEFMALEKQNLQDRYGVEPTHSAKEIELLASRFPDHIMLFDSEIDGALVAGGILYLNRDTAHLQYFASNEQGRELGAGDLVIESMLDFCKEHSISQFDFGISTEKHGQYLNTGLNRYKESFGAIGTTADFYSKQLSVC